MKILEHGFESTADCYHNCILRCKSAASLFAQGTLVLSDDAHAVIERSDTEIVDLRRVFNHQETRIKSSALPLLC
jgi:hypothetical protein